MLFQWTCNRDQFVSRYHVQAKIDLSYMFAYIFIGRTRLSLLLLSLTSTSAPIAKLTTDITRRDISRFSGVTVVNFVINVVKIYKQKEVCETYLTFTFH